MLNLKEYIKESILDDEDVVFNDDNIKSEIEKFIKDNYRCSRFVISNKLNKDGKFVVDGNSIQVINNNIVSLTNNLFIWGKVTRYFNCSYCDSLKSLEGAPKEVGENFDCSYCDSLTSLEGAPEEVGGNFNCSNCDFLTSLKGAPEEVGGDFYCSCCKSLTSLEGAPKKVKYDFNCSDCSSLTSLKGAPEKVSGDFRCANCNSLKSLEGAPKEVGETFSIYGNKFSIEDAEKVVKAKRIRI